MSQARTAARGFALAFTLAAAMWCTLAGAEQTSRVPRVGVLAPASSPNFEGLREGLRELGYVEGTNVAFETRNFEGTTEQASVAAAELIRAGVDIIVTSGTPAARGAMQATSTVPIVFGGAGDPVWAGLASSLAHPGRNGTGVSVVSTELYPKRLEYLHLLAPHARRIAFLMNSANPMAALQLDEVQKAAPKLGLQLQTFDARNEQELDAVLEAMRASKLDAIFVGGDTMFLRAQGKISRMVHEARLPAVFPYREYHEHGAIMSYGPSMKEVGRRAARYVDRILKGAKPAELPIEQISTYELVINLRLARALGLNVPKELLLRADKVIR